MSGFWLILGWLIIIVAVGRALAVRRRQLRRMQSLAATYRLRFSARDTIGLHDRYHNLDLIRQGHGRHICHVLHGRCDLGPLAFFSFNCDFGSGAYQDTRLWWFAVVETRQSHDHWLAVPKGAMTWPRAVEIDRFMIRCDHMATLDRLREIGLEPLLRESPDGLFREVRGPLVAVAASRAPSENNPELVIDAAIALARLLSEPPPAPVLSEAP